MYTKLIQVHYDDKMTETEELVDYVSVTTQELWQDLNSSYLKQLTRTLSAASLNRILVIESIQYPK